jgi:hypothetical protein
MSRGGRREGAGRPAGGTNRPKVQAALMSVAAKQKGRRGQLAVDYLQRNLSRFERLADAAWKARDPALFTRYSKVCIEIATSLATYQTPRLSAVATIAPQQRGSIDFELKIFDKQRVPVQIEARAVETTPAQEVTDAVAAEPEQPAAERPKAEASPAPPSPDQNNASPGPSWAQERSLYQHPSLSLARRWPWH